MVKPRWSLIVSAAMLGATLVAPTPTSAGPADDPGDPITNPIPEEPEMSRLALEVEELVQLPKSEPDPAPTDPRLQRWARINYIGEVPDGSGRLYVPDLNGMMYLVEDGRDRPYLDVGGAFEPDFFASAGMGSGFGFVAFHPRFATNGKFYTVHTENGAALEEHEPDLTPQPDTEYHGVITEWTADDPAADSFSGSSREILRLGFHSRIHGIQQIGFNPNAHKGDEDFGLLYVAAGDGGIGTTTDEPQNLGTPQGKILRIDPLGSNSDNGKYGIPDSNPFVGQNGAIGEIYAYGMRDPHRFSWDTGGKHRMFLGHIGEKDIEMVYDVLPGDNFGWSEREGRFVYNPDDPCNLYPLPDDDEKYGYVYPLAAYDHNRPPELECGADAGHAISGGQVYRGDVKHLRGKYIFGDLVDGRVLYTEERKMRRDYDRRATIHEMTLVDEHGDEVSMPQLAGDERVDLRFGTDSDDNLYLLAKANGTIWKVTGVHEVDRSSDVIPSVADSLQAYYDFEHPRRGDAGFEVDQGLSGTDIKLVNGGQRMRVRDDAYRASKRSMQTRQVSPDETGNDDWKSGVYSADGVDSLSAFNAVEGTTIMGWVKMTSDGPALDTTTPEPDDRYGAIGLVGLLSGNSDGHGVRALLELIEVDGQLRLVALGRRIDEGRSQTFAATEDWKSLLPKGEWVHLAATFNYNDGTMKLYRNGQPIEGFYTEDDDPWEVGDGGDFATSPTDPRGIKLGGSFPQNDQEKNACGCRMDSLMFIDRVVTQLEVSQQYRRAASSRP